MHNKRGGRGRPVLWVVLLITLAILTAMTVFAVRSNPYQTNAVYNGISKFKFVDECKEQIQAQLAQAPQKLNYRLVKAPQDFLQEVAQAPGGGWQWVSNMEISAPGQPGTQQLPFACQYDKKAGKTQLLGIGGGQQQAPQ